MRFPYVVVALETRPIILHEILYRNYHFLQIQILFSIYLDFKTFSWCVCLYHFCRFYRFYFEHLAPGFQLLHLDAHYNLLLFCRVNYILKIARQTVAFHIILFLILFFYTIIIHVLYKLIFTILHGPVAIISFYISSVVKSSTVDKHFARVKK